MSTISPLSSNTLMMVENAPRNTAQNPASSAVQSTAQVKPAYETAVPPIGQLPEPPVAPSEPGTGSGQINPTKKNVAEALIAGYQQQKLLNIYMENSNLDGSGGSTVGVAMSTFNVTASERSVARAISQYIDQSQAGTPPPEKQPKDS